MSRLAGSIGSRLWSSYNTALVTNPLLTKSFTSFTGFILGDGIAQLATKGPERYDYARTARFAAFGFCIHAPGCHYFYKALDSVVFPHAAKSTKAVLAKMLIDQTLWTPISICIFYSVFKTMEGRRDQILQTIKDKFWATLFAGYAVWPLAHVINFRFISSQHRVLYINCVQVGWNVVLCKIATSAPTTGQARSRSRELAATEEDVETGNRREVLKQS
jgi:protein Mpv17